MAVAWRWRIREHYAKHFTWKHLSVPASRLWISTGVEAIVTAFFLHPSVIEPDYRGIFPKAGVNIGITL